MIFCLYKNKQEDSSGFDATFGEFLFLILQTSIWISSFGDTKKTLSDASLVCGLLHPKKKEREDSRGERKKGMGEESEQ